SWIASQIVWNDGTTTNKPSGSQKLTIVDVGKVTNLTSFTDQTGLYPKAKIAKQDQLFSYSLNINQGLRSFAGMLVRWDFKGKDFTASDTIIDAKLNSKSSSWR